MGFRGRTALLLLVSAPIIGWSGISFAYRPFDSTDAAVADVGELEVEFGPVQFRRSNEEQTIIAPAYVLNFGFVKNWELVLEGRREHSLPPAEDTRGRFVGDALFLKGVLREGVLQDKSGPSVRASLAGPQRRARLGRQLGWYRLTTMVRGNDPLQPRRRAHARTPRRPLHWNHLRRAV